MQSNRVLTGLPSSSRKPIGAPASSVGYDSDLDEDYEHAERRFIEERLSRIEAAERSWNQKIATQNASANSVANSLVTLFKNMPRLRSIEISQWKFASYDGFEVVRYGTMFSYLR